MRRVYAIALLILISSSLSGCVLLEVDKNQNSYITSPWDAEEFGETPSE